MQGIWNLISQNTDILTYGIVGLAIGGKKGAVVLGGLAHMKTWVENFGKALGFASTGLLDFKLVAEANFTELAALVKRGEMMTSGDSELRRKALEEEIGILEKRIKEASEPLPGAIYKTTHPYLDEWTERLEYLKSQLSTIILPEVKVVGEQIQKNLGEAVDNAAKKTKVSAEDIAKAYREMYRGLGEDSEEYIKFELTLLEKQRDKYIELTGDKLLAEKWFAAEKKELLEAIAKAERENLRQRARASDDFFAGMKAALDEIQEDMMTLGEAGYQVMESFADNSQAVLSDVLFDGIKGDMDSFEDYWKRFCDSMLRTLTDIVAQMVLEWVLGMEQMQAASAATTAPGMPGGGLLNLPFGASSLGAMAGAAGIGYYSGGAIGNAFFNEDEAKNMGYGGAIGSGIGMAIGGPIGAVVGGGTGIIVGSVVDDVEDFVGDIADDVGDFFDDIFHKGGMVKAHQGLFIGPGLRSDERPIIAQTGEGILSREGMAALGGEGALNRLNAGEGSAPVHITIAPGVVATDDMESWIINLLERLQDRRGLNFATVDIVTQGINL